MDSALGMAARVFKGCLTKRLKADRASAVLFPSFGVSEPPFDASVSIRLLAQQLSRNRYTSVMERV